MKKVYLFVAMAAVLFGTMEVALKLAGNRLDPFQLTFLRFMIGGVLLLPFAVVEIRKRGTKLGFKDFMYLFLLGGLGIPLSMIFFQIGVMNSNAATASVLIAINPLFTLAFAHFLKVEKLDKAKIAVLLFGLLGILFMIKPWDMQEGNTVSGVIYMLLAAFFFGLYTVLGKISIKKMGIMAQTSFSFILGSFILLIIILFMGRPVFHGVLDNWLLVSYISIFVTGLGYLAYFTAIRMSDAATGSIAFFLKPAIAPVMAVIVLKEIILWNTYVGIGLIFVASYLNIYTNKKRVQIDGKDDLKKDREDSGEQDTEAGGET